MTFTNNIYHKQIKFHVFNAVTNSELTKLVPVFTMRPPFPTSIKKVNTSFKNVWRTWGPALPTLLADLIIFCPIGPTNFKSSELTKKSAFVLLISCSIQSKLKKYSLTSIASAMLPTLTLFTLKYLLSRTDLVCTLYAAVV